MSAPLPPGVRPLVAFARLLRAHGFAIAPEQTAAFIEAVGFLGPRSIADVRAAALAAFAVGGPEQGAFDALFRAFFLGEAMPARAEGAAEDEAEAHEARGAERDVEAAGDDERSGAEASAAERLARRDLRGPAGDPHTVLARARLPERRSPRRRPARRGDAPDPRRTLREAVRRDGEVVRLPQRRRRHRPRRIVLLIDVSGSMRERSDDTLAFAHALARRAPAFEAFTLGTRLTRITPALRVRDEAEALARLGGLVADLDGGTRLGGALGAFLDVPRFAASARGAAVMVVSDGLERGEPGPMIDAVARLSRLAWRLDWLSPLAADPAYRPETAGLAGALRHLDALADGGDPLALARHVAGRARAGRGAPRGARP
ncbi:MAG: VWA domain-containing protein [Paracoccaceae bacterium]